MAFSDYKSISQVQQEYKIRFLESHFLPESRLEPSKKFLAELEFSLENLDVFTSEAIPPEGASWNQEAARSKTIIFPILREVYKQFVDSFSLWIQKAIFFDTALSGTPDYLIGTKSELGKTVLETPLILVAEAKKNDFEVGWAQCLAELIAAKKINNDETRAVYGIVTDGKLWEFGKLEGSTFTKFVQSYTVDDLPELFGMLNAILNAARDALN
jgi:hypothetical protein